MPAPHRILVTRSEPGASETAARLREAGAVLLRLVDDRGLQLELDLSPEKAARVRVGDAVTLDTRQARAVITGVSPALQAGQLARARARVTERGSRADDKSSEAAMEDRKKEGYF